MIVKEHTCSCGRKTLGYKKCSSCRQKQYAENSKPRVQKHIRKATHKRKKQLKEYTKLRQEFLMKNSICEAYIRECQSDQCTVATNLTISHTKGRIEENLNDTKHWQTLCFNCHTYYTNHPKEAKEKGLEVSRLSE